MTKDEAIYCMQSYLPYDEYEHCTSCPYYGANDVDGQVSVCKSAEAHEMAINALKAEPVRHGKWIGYAGTIGNECSVCGKWIDVLQGTAEMNYCPNCGADMRSKE